MDIPRLQLTGITKAYPGTVANDGVSLTLMPGEIHAVLGENGAGKSTLMKIIYGSVQMDAGEIRVDGKRVQIGNPRQARALGVAMVFQHFNLFHTATVAENVWLGLEPGPTLEETRALIVAKAAHYGLDVDPERPVHTLSVGEMQRVEIIRALLANPSILILDEPTSVLTPQAVDKLFVVLRQLASEGCSILYISHKLHEIRALCTACTVLRAGRVTGVCVPAQESNASLSRLMIGSEPPGLARRVQEAGAVVLEVRGLSLPRADQYGVDLDQLRLQLRAGEVLGIAGVSGNGQQELLRVLSGEDRRAPAATVLIDGVDVSSAGPAARRARGLHFVPEERLGRGAVPPMSLADNLLLTREEAVQTQRWMVGWIDTAVLRRQANSIIDRFHVKAHGSSAAARSLSGGNLQKFIVGREIDAQPRCFIVSQPTWGVDVGASAQIRAAILAMRDAGCAVLLVSEELDELFQMADRLQVMAQGALSPALPIADATVEQVGQWMSGLWSTA